MLTHRESAEIVLVIAKEPVAGRVKTRLQARFSPLVAAELAEAALRDSLDAAIETGAGHAIVVLDGQPGGWLPAGVEVLPQRGGGLDERLANGFADAFARHGRRPALLIGMDTPQVDGRTLAAVDFTGVDAVLGLAADGGFWALGLRCPHPEALLGVPMSAPGTGAEQLRRLRAAGLRVRLLPELRDVDTPEDAEEVARAAPASRFAARYRAAVTHRRVQAVQLYEESLAGADVVVERTDHRGARAREALDAGRWAGRCDVMDRFLLGRCRGPVLDLGCGPGRLVSALSARGTPALGVDVSPAALAMARRRGADVLCRDLFDRLPGEGRWGSVLLADGNVGIGGRPDRLMRRCAELLDGGGLLLAEADPDPGVHEVEDVVLRSGDGRRWARLRWARLGADALVRHAGPWGFRPVERCDVAGRVLVVLCRDMRVSADAARVLAS